MSQDVVADLEIILTGNTAPYVGAMERAAAAGDAAATAAERAAEATAAAGQAATAASVGITRMAEQEVRSGMTAKQAALAQRELQAAVAANNRTNAESVAMMRATSEAAHRAALAMSETTASERAMRDAALRNAEALNIQATAAGRAASSAAREGAAQVAAARKGAAAAEEHHAKLTKLRGGLDKAALGVVALIGVSLKLAGDFQKDTSVLVTAAGESAGALEHIRAGLLRISTDTGTPLKQLTDGMYLVEKAGYRDADALRILQAAAQGAREENASLAAVTNAMTSVMASYHLGASSSVQVMNALKTAAGESKTTMEEYAAALSTVIPIASANKIGFEQVAGAIATLTQHGTSAAEATQELANTIRNLASPNNVAVTAMARMGLSAVDVARNLGKRGLTGTIDLLSSTVLQHMGPAGLVLTNAFNQSKTGAQDAQIMIANMDPALAALAKRFQAGAITAGDYGKALGHMTPQQASLGAEFKTTENKARGFNDLLRRGGPAASTYSSNIKQMTGGVNGLNTVLQVGGENMAGFRGRVQAVNKSLTDGGKDVEGWASTQKLANVATDRARQSLIALAIQLGTALLPAWTKLTSVVASAANWLGKHKTVAEALAAGLAVGLVGAIVAVNVALVMLAANPVTVTIMAVVAGIALLTAGFIIAWQKSETFRDVVVGVMDMLKTAFYGMVYGALSYFRLLLTVWLETAGGILHGAALMLGWVPGLGGKLKAADHAFRGFKDGALSTIDKLRDGMKKRMEDAARQTAYQSALTGQALKAGIADRLPAYLAIADKYGKTLPQVLHDARLPAKDSAVIMTQAVDAGIRSQLDRVREGGRRIGAVAVEGVAAHVGLANQAGQNLALGARGGVSSVGGFETLGANAGQGFVNGLNSMYQSVSNSAFGMAKIASDAVAAANVQHSPSRVYHGMGVNAGKGYALGLTSTHAMVADAAAGMAAAAAIAVGDMTSGASGGGSRPITARPSGLPAISLGGGSTGASSSSGTSRSGAAVIDLHVHLDGREIHRSVQTHELQYQGRNPRPSTSRR